MSFRVAVDGPAASGKGTIAKAVAQHFGFHYLDTGLLYRGVGKKALAHPQDGFRPDTAEQFAKELIPDDLTADDLRTADVANAASKVAAIPEVRTALIEFQKTFAKQEPGAVLDGRDIGTVICPDAEVKLFVTAKSEVRAARRFQELAAQGSTLVFADVLADVKARDARDRTREAAPLIQADDAVLIDTSDIDIKTAIDAAVAVVQPAYTSR